MITDKHGAGRMTGWILVAWLGASAMATAATALDEYVRRPDPCFEWKVQDTRQEEGCTVAHLRLTSQQWREHTWTHHLQIIRPAQVRQADIAFLFVTGDGDGAHELGIIKAVAERAGSLAAVLTQVPNQPLYDGLDEDALIAYTFDQFARTGDTSWPLLLPMVKSAVRAMDALQAYAREAHGQTLQRFVVGGASKRGWTTWLTGAADPRVVAIAPMVIDMLNMKTQIDWTQKVYGEPSEQIHDYTDLRLHLRLDEPRMMELRRLVDPYHYRDRYTMPKLILLGTNDRYWTVDALRHYWNELPEPKLVFQTPNAGHDLGGGDQALQTLAAFFEMIAARQPIPRLSWQFQPGPDHEVRLQVRTDQQAKAIRLWTAQSADRDFRDDTWSSQALEIQSGSSHAQTTVAAPPNGYRAYLLEAILTSPSGHDYKLSTEARVTPDTTP